MKFVDYVKINLRAGRGGNGCAAFRREKFVPHGGPNGGDGGGGGAIYFQGNKAKSTLLDFQFRQHFHAPDGTGGMGKNRHGRRAEPLVLQVPLGTVVREIETGELLLEVVSEEPELCLKGGRGGRGNTRFKTSTNRLPEEAEEGQPGADIWVSLELKLMADVGLVGFPNTGKSTLISRISQARPKIADYPFTTLVPNLGVVKTEGFESFVVADIPGIIQGAHEGTGLGLRFLRHIERTAILLLLLDVSEMAEREPLDEYRILLEELGAFSPLLPEKPRAIALNKTDAAQQPAELEALAERLREKGEEVFPISAVTGAGVAELLRFLAARVLAARKEPPNPDAPGAASTRRTANPRARPSAGGT